MANGLEDPPHKIVHSTRISRGAIRLRVVDGCLEGDHERLEVIGLAQLSGVRRYEARVGCSMPRHENKER